MKHAWKILLSVLFLVVLCSAGCSGARYERASEAETAPVADPTIQVTLLQINDVYEIQPVSGGTRGGLARVATIRKELLAENPNTYTVIAGDFFSPSALGTAVVDGKRLDGRQMVAVLNTMGLDYATFGNHEFDLKKDPFYERMSESQFTWVSSNVFDAAGKPFPGVSSHEIIEAPGSGGEVLRLGLIGATLGKNKPDYVTYNDPLAALQREAKALAGRVDVLVALTHLAFVDDQVMAEQIPELDLILGGHEHENMLLRRGDDYTPILKADANAKSVYVHHLVYHPRTKQLDIQSTFLPVTEAIADDPETARDVEEWVEAGYQGFRDIGFDPDEKIADVPEALDGLEASVRNRPTALTRLIAAAMMSDAEGAELAVYNGGSIRIDDVIPPGPVTQYDVLRILPFPGAVWTVDVKGSLLDSTLTQGSQNQGAGGYLQTNGKVERRDGTWRLNGEALDPEKVYRVAINDYLASGRQSTLEFLNVDDANPNSKLVKKNDDVRQALIRELKARYPIPQ